MRDLYRALAAAGPDLSWLDAALARVADDPAAIEYLFPAAARHCGRDRPLAVEGWTAQDAGRALLLAALPLREGDLVKRVEDLYRYGDAAEKRAILRALPTLPIGTAATHLLEDAIRSNDTRLVAAALGRYSVHLDAATWRQAVLKCVFMGVPLSVVHGLHDRADGELGRMLAAFATERRAAGREVPADALALLSRLE
jgi:hypothetical protein